MSNKHLSNETDIKGDTVLGHHEDLEYDVAGAENGAVNALRGIPKGDLYEQVEAFTREHGLEENTEVFKQGALVAQHPLGFDHMEEVSAEDKAALRYEIDHKWSQTRPLYFTVFVCAIGAACQGCDQTGSNGANLSFPQEFGIAIPYGEPGGGSAEWKVGFVNSAPYISAALAGVWRE